VVQKFRPDTILTFGPDGLTGHPDHQAVSRWAMGVATGKVRVLWAVTEPEQYDQLREMDRQANIFFNIDRPPLVQSEDCAVDLRLAEDVTALKRRAFEAVPSQFEKVLAAQPFARAGEGLARECFVIAKGGNNG